MKTANLINQFLIDLNYTIGHCRNRVQAEVAEVTSFPSSMEGALERPKCL